MRPVDRSAGRSRVSWLAAELCERVNECLIAITSLGPTTTDRRPRLPLAAQIAALGPTSRTLNRFATSRLEAAIKYTWCTGTALEPEPGPTLERSNTVHQSVPSSHAACRARAVLSDGALRRSRHVASHACHAVTRVLNCLGSACVREGANSSYARARRHGTNGGT